MAPIPAAKVRVRTYRRWRQRFSTMLGVFAFGLVIAFIGAISVGSAMANLAFVIFTIATVASLAGFVYAAIFEWRLLRQ